MKSVNRIILHDMSLEPKSPNADPLLLACTTGDVDSLNRHLESTTDILKRLHDLARAAIVNDHPMILQRLLAIPRSDIVQVKGISLTAYIAFNALCREPPTCLQVLLDNGLNPDHCIGHDGDLVQHAVRYGNIDSLKILLSAGASPQHSEHGWLPAIAMAAGDKRKDMVTVLMKYGADLKNSMAIQNAAGYATVEMVTWLQDLGADIDEYPVESGLTWRCKSSWGTPLHWAAEAKNWEVVEFLLAKGVKMDIKDAQGRSVLETGDEDDVLGRLLDKYSKKRMGQMSAS